MREVKAGRGSPHGGVFLDIAWIKKRLPDAEAHIKRKLRACTTSSRSSPTSTSPRSRWKSVRRRTTSWAASGSTPTRRCRRSRTLRGGRMRRWHQRRQPPGRQLAVRPAGLREARGRVRGPVRARERRAAIDDGAVDRGDDDALAPFERGERTARTRTRSSRPAGDDAEPGRHRPHRSRNAAGAGGARHAQRRERRASA